jgi:type II secretory pathway component GspD/PulD (secretin)
MSLLVWLVAVCGFAFAPVAAFAEEPKAKKADPLEQVLAALDQEVQLKDGTNLNELPLFELLQDIAKRYNLNVVINEDAFKQMGLPNIREEKPSASVTQLRGATVRQFLNLTLDGMGAAYLLKNGTVEIVPTRHAAKVTKSGVGEDESGRARLNEPLVSAAFKEKPLNEAVAKLAEMYDLTVVVSPQAGDAKTGFVTARLLNLPADKALELLALQCDLRVVRKGNAFLLTSREHANELFGEKLDRERQKIEVEKLREAPAQPPAKPDPAPEK